MASERTKAIAAMVDRFLADSMLDPDIAERSEEFKAGYRKGFREALAAILVRFDLDCRGSV